MAQVIDFVYRLCVMLLYCGGTPALVYLDINNRYSLILCVSSLCYCTVVVDAHWCSFTLITVILSFYGCICKTMERIINRRLVWYLESHKLLTNVQCGFRSRRSTVDHLVTFERFCREAFIHNQHLVFVFFDLEKAYDTTWKYGIMKDLHGFGLRGRLPNFISNILQDRSFKLRVGSTFSDSHPQEMGVPQGSILSVTLFPVKIKSIIHFLKPGVDCSLYVDDFQVCYRSSTMSIIERQLQLCLNKLQQWATDNGFQFSKTKTVCMHISQKRGLHLDPQLFLDKSPIIFWTKVQFQ